MLDQYNSDYRSLGQVRSF